MSSPKKIGVVGAGNMGNGIAQKAAQEGFSVVMIDIKEEFVQRGMDNIRNTLDEAVQRKIMSQEKSDEVMGRITGTTDVEQVKDADLIIEAVFEDFNVKKELFDKLDNVCQDSTILATNTSALSVTDLARETGRPDRFVGMHFFYHPAKNRLVEVIPGKNTSKETRERTWEISKLMGKTPIHTEDVSGFAVNRFFVPWLNEATRMLEENVANIPTIDEAAKKAFRIGMGPFLLMNVTGVPIAYHSARSLENLHPFYAPSDILKTQVDRVEKWDLEGEVDESRFPEIERRFLGMVFNVAGKLVEEGVASIEDTDRGAKVGLRWSMGPFEIMNRHGIKESVEMAREVSKRYEDWPVPKMLLDQAEKGQPWHFRLVDLDIKDGVGWITVNRPEAMNALNEEVMEQLDRQFTVAESDPDVKAIVLQGAGKAFIAGADIGYFIKKIKKGRIDDIVSFTRKGQEFLTKLQDSDKLTIALLDGLSLGGGSETAMACKCIVATDGGSMGFPETGIGIYPGLGGTQRTPRYVGKALARYLVLTGRPMDARSAHAIGLVDYIVSREEVASFISELATRPNSEIMIKNVRPESVPETIDDIPDKLAAMQGLFTGDALQRILDNNPTDDELEQKMAKIVSFKAPMATKLAVKLIGEGADLPIEEGLEMELSNLSTIFATKDALAGLTSVGRGRPEFTGE